MKTFTCLTPKNPSVVSHIWNFSSHKAVADKWKSLIGWFIDCQALMSFSLTAIFLVTHTNCTIRYSWAHPPLQNHSSMVAGVSLGCGDINTPHDCVFLADSCLTLAEIMGAYQQNCSRHQVQPRPHILQQLQVCCYTHCSNAAFVRVKQHGVTENVCVYILVNVQYVCFSLPPSLLPQRLWPLYILIFFHRVISKVLQLHVRLRVGFLFGW